MWGEVGEVMRKKLIKQEVGEGRGSDAQSVRRESSSLERTQGYLFLWNDTFYILRVTGKG